MISTACSRDTRAARSTFIYKPIEPHDPSNKADVFFQLYRQKQQLARELQERTETLRLNEMFTAVLGHDLRNPLSAILSSAAAIQVRSNDSWCRRPHGARSPAAGGCAA